MDKAQQQSVNSASKSVPPDELCKYIQPKVLDVCRKLQSDKKYSRNKNHHIIRQRSGKRERRRTQGARTVISQDRLITWKS